MERLIASISLISMAIPMVAMQDNMALVPSLERENLLNGVNQEVVINMPALHNEHVIDINDNNSIQQPTRRLWFSKPSLTVDQKTAIKFAVTSAAAAGLAQLTPISGGLPAVPFYSMSGNQFKNLVPRGAENQKKNWAIAGVAVATGVGLDAALYYGAGFNAYAAGTTMGINAALGTIKRSEKDKVKAEKELEKANKKDKKEKKEKQNDSMV